MRSQSSVAVCPVRRRCPRFQAPGYTLCRAGHDQGPHGYPVSEVGPMVRSVTLLTVIVTLSLERPHSSCKDARPEALAGTKDNCIRRSISAHLSARKQGTEDRGDKKNKIKTQWMKRHGGEETGRLTKNRRSLEQAQRLILYSSGISGGVGLWPPVQFFFSVKSHPINVTNEAGGQPN